MPHLDLTAYAATDPTSIYRYRDALFAADLLTVGLVELDLFTWVAGRGKATQSEVCSQFQIAVRPADTMLTLFTAMGYLARNGDTFWLTPLATEHLVQGSPWFLGPYYASLRDRPVCKDYQTVLRTGRAANWGSIKNEKAWTQAMEEPAFARNFTAAMDCRGAYLGRAMTAQLDLNDFSRFLDIAGGSGIYACAVAAANPTIQATVYEKAPVDRIAAMLIEERGFSSRVSVASGDMFAQPLPNAYDVHLFSNVLHDWDVDQVEVLLAKSFTALEPGGMVVIHDAHLNAEKNGPLHVAEYSALLMHSTEGRCYSVAEMARYLETAGFGEVKFKPTAAARSIITARKAA